MKLNKGIKPLYLVGLNRLGILRDNEMNMCNECVKHAAGLYN